MTNTLTWIKEKEPVKGRVNMLPGEKMYTLYHGCRLMAVVTGDKCRWGGTLLCDWREHDFYAVIYTSARAAMEAVKREIEGWINSPAPVKPDRVRKAYTVWIPEIIYVPHMVAAFNEKDAVEQVPRDDRRAMYDQQESSRRIPYYEEKWKVEPAEKLFQENIIESVLGEELGRTW